MTPRPLCFTSVSCSIAKPVASGGLSSAPHTNLLHNFLLLFTKKVYNKKSTIKLHAPFVVEGVNTLLLSVLRYHVYKVSADLQFTVTMHQ